MALQPSEFLHIVSGNISRIQQEVSSISVAYSGEEDIRIDPSSSLWILVSLPEFAHSAECKLFKQ
jgi:hypothetical protein